jgi:hypothetical protein
LLEQDMTLLGFMVQELFQGALHVVTDLALPV